jgi:hypothetical protein
MIAVLFIAACSDDDALSPGATTIVATTTTIVPAATTTTPVPATTAPNQSGPVTPADLTAAERAVLTFVESLGRGDLDAAGRVVGPVSEERTEAAGGLRSMLQQSTEGHGTWLAATDRTVTSIGVDLGLVAVVLEGTLRVEGTVEHRVAVFPVRKAESAATWFVEPWAYDIHSGGSFRISKPVVDAEEWATAATPLDVTIETDTAGTAWTSFDAQLPIKTTLAQAGASTVRPAAGRAKLVMVLFQSGPTLFGSGFRVKTGAG